MPTGVTDFFSVVPHYPTAFGETRCCHTPIHSYLRAFIQTGGVRIFVSGKSGVC